MKKVRLEIMQLPHGADLPLPAYQSAGASGLDLHAAVPADAPVILQPGERAMIPTGIAIELPRGTEGQVRPRSGLAARHGVTVLNSPGTVDADYRGEVSVILLNLGGEPFLIERGLRLAQLVIMPVLRAEIARSRKLRETKRGSKGFGSTGKQAIDKRRKSRP
jgi:dUTP pyrophosphatase